MYISTLTGALLLSGLASAAPAATVEEGLARRFTGPSDPRRFRFYKTPTGATSGICDMDTGPDGKTLWYQDLIASKMGVFDSVTHKFKEYTIPYSQNGTGTVPGIGNVTALQCVVRTGKDGKIYGGAGTRNEIVQIDPKTNKVRVIKPEPGFNPGGNLLNFNDAWAGDNELFFSQTTGNVVTSFNYKTEKFRNYPVPTPNSGPLGMRTDKQGNLWFTEFFAQKIAKLEPKSGKITEYPVPLPAGAFPEVLRAQTEDQKYLWANAFGAGGFIRIEVATGKLTTFTNPDPRGPLSFPFEDDNDPYGRIWYSSPTQNIFVHYNPKTGKWVTVEVPGALPAPGGDFEVAIHNGPQHSMWFTEGTTNVLGQYLL